MLNSLNAQHCAIVNLCLTLALSEQICFYSCSSHSPQGPWASEATVMVQRRRRSWTCPISSTFPDLPDRPSASSLVWAGARGWLQVSTWGWSRSRGRGRSWGRERGRSRSRGRKRSRSRGRKRSRSRGRGTSRSRGRGTSRSRG